MKKIKKIKFNKSLYFALIVILFILCIILGVFCVKFHNDIDDYKKDAEYTYNLYLQGISDTEKKMYQEWINSLEEDELTAYKQGYSDGREAGYEDQCLDSYEEGYNKGYEKANKESNNLDFIVLFVIILLDFAFIFNVYHKISKKIEN